MIPIHDRSKKQKSKVVIHELQKLTDYDSSEAHRHNYFEFFVFEKGEGIHLIDFEEFPIESNTVHIVAPGQVHQVKRGLSSNGYVFLFDHGLFNSNKRIEDFLFDHICLDVQEFAPNYTFEKSFQKKIIEVARKGYTEFQSNLDFKNLLVENHLTELLLYCMQAVGHSTNRLESSDNDVYISFRKLLKQEFKHLKKVKEYASEMAISEKRLNEIVYNRTGETVSSLIYKQLVLEAKRLLNIGMTSKETSYELNFNEPSHFSKFFKSQTGISPTEFLKVHD